MTKATGAQYRLEFKQEAARMVESGQCIAGAARGPGVWWSKPCTTGQSEAGRTAEGSGQQ
jgi:hypothetical protein